MRVEFPVRGLAAAVAAVLSVHGGAARAAEKGMVLEEVVVTATKQEETVNNVGASIVAIDNRQIDDMGFRSLSALVQSMPNVNVQEAATGTKLTIRGVGTIPTGGASSAVATFVDGVYQANSSLTNNILTDMQRVEVLRGPQGTLFGKNSISGVMNLITNRPTSEFEGLVDVRAGNRDSHEGTVVLSGGLTDTVAARVSVFKQHAGDYLDNTTGPGGAGGSDKESYRFSVNWDAGDNTSVWFKYQHDHVKTNAAINQLIALDPKDAAMIAAVDPALLAKVDTKLDGHFATTQLTRYGYDTGLNPETVLNAGRDIAAVSLNHTFDNEFELTATAGCDRNKVLRRGTVSQDFPLLTIYLNNDNLYESKNFELRVSSPTQDRFHYTVGAYAEKSRFGIDDGGSLVAFDSAAPAILGTTDVATLRAFTPAFIADLGTPYGWNDVTSLAAYAQGTFEFDDAWSLTAGLRFAADKIEQEKYFDNRVDLNGNVLFSPEAFAALGANPVQAQSYSTLAKAILGNPNVANVGFPGEPDFNETHKDRALLPAAKLEYRPDPDALYYLSIQSGYKNGGYSTDGLKYPSEFDKETSIAYELGGKWTLADGRGQAAAALFRTDFKDFQVATIDSSSGGVAFKNAAEAYTEGLELETRWKLTEEIAVGLQYAYLEAHYRSFPDAPGSISQLILDPKATQDLGGKTLPNAPRNSASASVDYVQPLFDSLQFVAGVQVSYMASNYTDLADSSQLMADSATLVNGRLALTDTEDLWTVALIGNNLTNDRGQVYGTPSSIVGKGTYFGSIRPPATYWLQLEKRF